jgi:hypothetical protein
VLFWLSHACWASADNSDVDILWSDPGFVCERTSTDDIVATVVKTQELQNFKVLKSFYEQYRAFQQRFSQDPLCSFIALPDIEYQEGLGLLQRCSWSDAIPLGFLLEYMREKSPERKAASELIAAPLKDKFPLLSELNLRAQDLGWCPGSASGTGLFIDPWRLGVTWNASPFLILGLECFCGWVCPPQELHDPYEQACSLLKAQTDKAECERQGRLFWLEFSELLGSSQSTVSQS